MPLSLITADITSLPVDAIVNAANPSLLGGGGVDGAIHAAAGPALFHACQSLPERRPKVRCATGDAVITDGFALPARHVIHTVGPIWLGGGRQEATLLARCYRQCMLRLRERKLSTIAFPAISCGVYGYPVIAAARIAVATLRETLLDQDDVDVTLCAFSDPMHAVLQRALQDR